MKLPRATDSAKEAPASRADRTPRSKTFTLALRSRPSTRPQWGQIPDGCECRLGSLGLLLEAPPLLPLAEPTLRLPDQLLGPPGPGRLKLVLAHEGATRILQGPKDVALVLRGRHRVPLAVEDNSDPRLTPSDLRSVGVHDPVPDAQATVPLAVVSAANEGFGAFVVASRTDAPPEA